MKKTVDSSVVLRGVTKFVCIVQDWNVYSNMSVSRLVGFIKEEQYLFIVVAFARYQYSVK